ncbi:MAG: hypothetical protein WCP23_06070 [Planctomycetota bacterium]|nr:hypothetical protein [Planctomycetia bacterium]
MGLATARKSTNPPWYSAKVDRSFLGRLVTLHEASVRQHVLAMAPNGNGSKKLIRLLENVAAMAV